MRVRRNRPTWRKTPRQVLAFLAALAMLLPVLAASPASAQSPVPVVACWATDIGGGQVRVTWTRPGRDDSANRFLVHRSRNGGQFFWAGRVSAPATSFVNSGVGSGTYRYRVHTVASNGVEATQLCGPDNGVTIGGGGGGGGGTRPNILIIMTDDQRRDGMAVMPHTKWWFGQGGTDYKQGYVTTPSCCPSRVTLLSGRYNHNNGTIFNSGPVANTNTFFNKHLQESGYLTGHVGKYFNYTRLDSLEPNWDRYTSYGCCYYNQVFNFDGDRRVAPGYATDVVLDTAIDYVRDFEARNDNQPWMMHVTTTAPHRAGFDPPQPAPEYVNAPVPFWNRDPAVLETDLSDKPPFIYCCNITPENISATRDGMYRSLMSVDDGINRLMNELAVKGELENTLAFFLSDNGWMFSDHATHEKFLPYKNSVRVPFYVRWPGRVAAGATSDKLVGNVDIAATALAAAGVTPPTPLDGYNILGSHNRSHRLTEYWQDELAVRNIPDWAAYTTQTVQYTEYYNSNGVRIFQEYYDLVNDPFELENLMVTRPVGSRPDVSALSAQIARDRSCVQSSCP